MKSQVLIYETLMLTRTSLDRKNKQTKEKKQQKTNKENKAASRFYVCLKVQCILAMFVCENSIFFLFKMAAFLYMRGWHWPI